MICQSIKASTLWRLPAYCRSYRTLSTNCLQWSLEAFQYWTIVVLALLPSLRCFCAYPLRFLHTMAWCGGGKSLQAARSFCEQQFASSSHLETFSLLVIDQLIHVTVQVFHLWCE